MPFSLSAKPIERSYTTSSRIVTLTVPEKEFSFKDIVIDESKHLAKVKDNLLNLTLKEYILLKLLVKKATSVVTREQILIEVWGQEYIGETRTLDIHIATLRKNISLSDCEIVTIRGVGYMLK